MRIKLGAFLGHKLLCYKLRLSLLEKMNFLKSILMQSNSVSAKIVILSLF